ncbi:hypothetical protein [Sorangium sp. So ce1389]|uniref:hypothetical protein n=1 Tax=Sorangium sp. So ce1389 TaxID=3133336 RepID=UPI003F60AC5D
MTRAIRWPTTRFRSSTAIVAFGAESLKGSPRDGRPARAWGAEEYITVRGREAAERGPGPWGGVYHGVGGEIPNRWIADAVARDMGCEARSLSAEEALEVWEQFGTLIMASSSRSRSSRARAELGWTAEKTDHRATQLTWKGKTCAPGARGVRKFC